MSGRDPEELFKSAVAAHVAGETEKAQRLYEETLALAPMHAGALANTGRLARARGDHKAALEYYERAAAIEGAPAEVFFNLGNTLAHLGERSRARAAYSAALDRAPDFAEARRRLAALDGETHRNPPDNASAIFDAGVAAERAGAIEDAIANYRRALAVNPRHDAAATRLAQLLFRRGEGDAAVALLEAARDRNPDDADALQNLGFVYRSTGHYAKALTHFEKARRLAPERDILRIEVANCLVNLGRAEEGRAMLAGMQETPQGRRAGSSSYLMALLYDPSAEPSFIRDEHRRLTRDWRAEPRPARRRPAGRAMRVGYLTGDFYGNHPVAQFIAPVIAEHATAGYDIRSFAYDANPRHDATARQMAKLCSVASLADLDDDAAASRIRQDDLDLLVDLSGHTSGRRLPILGLRPAPVQACFIGYPSTTGFAAVDYLIGDAALIPQERNALYTEEIARLPDSFLCFVPPAGMPAPRPRGASERIVFGSLNHLPKLNAEVIRCWASVLRATPASELLLQCAAFAEPETVAHVRAMFEAAGAPGSALRFHGPQPFEQAMRRYDEIDIALDPFPYNGGTTTCHALWMGKPVVSLAGEYFCGRMGASLLTAATAPEWIAGSVPDYVVTAARLAADIRAMRHTRRSWRDRLVQTPLFDLPRYARNLAELFKKIV